MPRYAAHSAVDHQSAGSSSSNSRALFIADHRPISAQVAVGMHIERASVRHRYAPPKAKTAVEPSSHAAVSASSTRITTVNPDRPLRGGL